MLEQYLIYNCCCTLACIKTGSLFSWPGAADHTFWRQMAYWNRCLGAKGICLRVLRYGKRSVLIYVYRPARLAADLSRPDTAAFLRSRGYGALDVESALDTLTRRLQDYEEFPHEIGLFLDYPLDDVAGFIENSGKNCRQIGCWKVYANEQQAARTFARYRRCREAYIRMWHEGKSPVQLTVAGQRTPQQRCFI